MAVPVTHGSETRYYQIGFSKPVTMSLENFNPWLQKFLASRLFSLMLTDVDEFCKLTIVNPTNWDSPIIMEFQLVGSVS